MIIKINDKEFGFDNYKCCILVNNKPIEYNIGDKQINAIFDSKETDNNVNITFTNIILSYKHGVCFIIFYWIISLISGISERNFMGKPFDAELSFTCSNEDNINICANSIWKSKPFTFEKEIKEHKNLYYSRNKYKLKWILGVASFYISILLMISLLLFFLEFQSRFLMIKYIFIIFAVIGVLAWIFYTYKVLTRFK